MTEAGELEEQEAKAAMAIAPRPLRPAAAEAAAGAMAERAETGYIPVTKARTGPRARVVMVEITITDTPEIMEGEREERVTAAGEGGAPATEVEAAVAEGEAAAGKMPRVRPGAPVVDLLMAPEEYR